MDESNLVDGMADIRQALCKVANAITPLSAAPGHDATGGTIASLTEAAMGITAGLVRIADAIESLASAVSDLKPQAAPE